MFFVLPRSCVGIVLSNDVIVIFMIGGEVGGDCLRVNTHVKVQKESPDIFMAENNLKKILIFLGRIFRRQTEQISSNQYIFFSHSTKSEIVLLRIKNNG